MSISILKTQVTQALDSLNDADLQNVVQYVEFLKFRARHYPYQITDAIAARYAEFAEEDRAFAEHDLNDYHAVLQREDLV